MILGIYFNYYNFRRLSRGNLDWKMNVFAESAFREGVKLLVFSPLSIDWHSENVSGLTYSIKNEGWVPFVCNFPDIIYDRTIFSEKEKEIGNLVRHRLNKKYKIPFINSKSYFNKQEIRWALSKNPAVLEHLPDTSRYQHPFQIIDFVDKYNSAYIKDSVVGKEKKIYKVQKADDNLYSLNYQVKGTKSSNKLSAQEIHNFFVDDEFIGKSVIIQQGIDIAMLDDCPFDIRVLAQKKDLATWEVVDKSLRIAAPGSMITNISSGGRVGKFVEIIPSLFSNSDSITDEVDKLVIDVCILLEQKYGSLGELGIDIAIDKQGKVWLINVNGKPAKVCVYHSRNSTLIEKTCINIVRYAKELFELSD